MTTPVFLFNFGKNGIVVQVTSDVAITVRYTIDQTSWTYTNIRQQRGNVYQFETPGELEPDIDYFFESVIDLSNGEITRSPQLTRRSPTGLIIPRPLVPIFQNVSNIYADGYIRAGLGITVFFMYKRVGDATYSQTRASDQAIRRFFQALVLPLTNYQCFAKLVVGNDVRVGNVIAFASQANGCPRGYTPPGGIIRSYYDSAGQCNLKVTVNISEVINTPNAGNMTVENGGVVLAVPLTYEGTNVSATFINLVPNTSYTCVPRVSNAIGIFNGNPFVARTYVLDNAMRNVWNGFADPNLFLLYAEDLDAITFKITPVGVAPDYVWSIEGSPDETFTNDVTQLVSAIAVGRNLYSQDISTQIGVGVRYIRGSASIRDQNATTRVCYTQTRKINVQASLQKRLKNA